MMKNNLNTESKKDDILDEILSNVSEADLNRTRTRMRISANLFDILKRKRIQNQELANRLKKQPSEISRWLSGSHNFTTDTLSDIAYALHIRVEDLLSQKYTDVVFSGQWVIRMQEMLNDPPVIRNSYLPSNIVHSYESPMTSTICIYYGSKTKAHLIKPWTIERMPTKLLER